MCLFCCFCCCSALVSDTTYIHAYNIVYNKNKNNNHNSHVFSFVGTYVRSFVIFEIHECFCLSIKTAYLQMLLLCYVNSDVKFFPPKTVSSSSAWCQGVSNPGWVCCFAAAAGDDDNVVVAGWLAGCLFVCLVRVYLLDCYNYNDYSF